MELELNTSPELAERIKELVPALEEQGVEALVVFTHRRPGEPKFWLAHLIIDERSYVLGTPDLRELPLREQADELLRLLARPVDVLIAEKRAQGEGLD